MAAVDIALWDLRGVREQEPLWRMLGGCSGRAQAYAGGIDLQLSREGLLEQTRANLEAGFRAIKIKVGRERLGEDIERVRAVRGTHRPRTCRCWSTPTCAGRSRAAIRAARAFRELDVYWLEEPTIRRTTAATRASRARAGCRWRPARISAASMSFAT